MGFFSKFFLRRGWDTKCDSEGDYSEIRKKYENFRKLLNLNNDVLEQMAHLEGMLSDGTNITMPEIRQFVEKMHSDITQLVDALNIISDNRYRVLYQNIQKISMEIEEEMKQVKGVPLTRPCLPLEEIGREMSDAVGGKVANLGEVRNRIGLLVPNGFAITAFAYRLFIDGSGIQNELSRLWGSIEWDDMKNIIEVSKKMQDVVLNARIPEDLLEAIRLQIHDLHRKMKGKREVSVRSSAIGEDGRSSFAGQYTTFLNVPLEQVVRRYQAVIASKYSPRALFYMHTHGFEESDLAMSVGCFEMIHPKVSGVGYSVDPNDPNYDKILICASWNLGKTVVDGTITPDTYWIPRRPGRGDIAMVIGSKAKRLVCAQNGGIVEEDVPIELREKPCLTNEQVERLAEYLRTIEAHYRCPQDVEWALDDRDRFFILQVRPLRLGAIHHENERIQIDIEKHPILIKGGVTASSGVGSGIVVRAFSDDELACFPDGGVLVAHQNSPRFVKVMMKASAIVTEVGSAAGHMASLAREYRIPTLVDVRDASCLLDGMEVTVDAGNRCVYAGRVERLISNIAKQALLLRDAPALAVLERVLGRVAKLNLVDPSRNSFRAKNCKTYHDIVRFCHEMAICEMFQLNDYRNLSEHGVAYKLESEIPLRIYIIDLGGGLMATPDNKIIRPEHISSKPMLALWRGITTKGITWAGARPIDLKGFVSVFANTLYDPAKGERGLGENSYAILSRDYMNFGSRLGYHFTTLDAVCSEDIRENYIIFRLKGGAADIERRVRRARFVSDVLAHFGFQVDQKEDVMNAWVKKLPCSEIEELLSMIGRLIGCARQLDVVMETNSTTEACINAFIQGDYEFFEFKAKG